jgi:hypothetical protein
MGGGGVPISPELALIDPLLRADAIRAMPFLEPFEFLRFPQTPVLTTGVRTGPPLLVAALVYLLASAARFAVSGVLTVAGVALVAAILYAIG